MTGLESLVVGYLTGWVARKVRRVGDRTDSKVDNVLDASVDRLGDLVLRKLRRDPALEQLERDAAAGVDNERTRLRVTLALEDALEQDHEFADQLRALVRQIRSHSPAPSPDRHVVINARAEGRANMPVLGTGEQHNVFGGSGGT